MRMSMMVMMTVAVSRFEWAHKCLILRALEWSLVAVAWSVAREWLVILHFNYLYDDD